MSTRSQLRFVQSIEYENEDGETESTRRIAQVYRHSDGYPESVLPALAQLKALQDETDTERDPAYVAANFIFLNKLQVMGRCVDRDGGFGGAHSTDDVMVVIEENDVSGVASLEQPTSCWGTVSGLQSRVFMATRRTSTSWSFRHVIRSMIRVTGPSR